MKLLPKLFLFDEEELVPELRAQRTLNKARIPEIARYITTNPTTYIFSAITASVDGEMKFSPIGEHGEERKIGVLHIPMDASFVINDGQHRRAAIEAAIREHPELGEETIAVVFFMDVGLSRSQQMFADLNRHAIRPDRSLGLLYDHRDAMAKVARAVAQRSEAFRDLVEMERSTLSPRSRKLFTLSAIHTATDALLSSLDPSIENEDERVATAVKYWDEVGKHFREWHQVRTGSISAGEIRRDFIHSHSITLQAIGKVGGFLLREKSGSWQKHVPKLATIDWARSNGAVWEGRATIGGRVSKSSQNVTLTVNLIKRRLGLSLTPEEQRAEDAHLRGHHAA
jgi:DNA sulfur modification protein DndB